MGRGNGVEKLSGGAVFSGSGGSGGMKGHGGAAEMVEVVPPASTRGPLLAVTFFVIALGGIYWVALNNPGLPVGLIKRAEAVLKGAPVETCAGGSAGDGCEGEDADPAAKYSSEPADADLKKDRSKNGKEAPVKDKLDTKPKESRKKDTVDKDASKKATKVSSREDTSSTKTGRKKDSSDGAKKDIEKSGVKSVDKAVKEDATAEKKQATETKKPEDKRSSGVKDSVKNDPKDGKKRQEKTGTGQKQADTTDAVEKQRKDAGQKQTDTKDAVEKQRKDAGKKQRDTKDAVEKQRKDAGKKLADTKDAVEKQADTKDASTKASVKTDREAAGKQAKEKEPVKQATKKDESSKATNVEEKKKKESGADKPVEKIRAGKTAASRAANGNKDGGKSQAKSGNKNENNNNGNEDTDDSVYYNRADRKIRAKLDAARKLLDQKKLKEALEAYTQLTQEHPGSAQAALGRGLVLNDMATKQRSNQVLGEAIEALRQVVTDPALKPTPELRLAALQHYLSRAEFRGWLKDATRVLQSVIKDFPGNLTLRNKLGTMYLIAGRTPESKRIFEQVLEEAPDDGYAKVHYGFILKNNEDLPGAINMLQSGIDSGHEGTQDGRFYFHLGDAYYRTGHPTKAQEIYQRGADQGLFLSAYQRSMYNCEDKYGRQLKSRPYWTKEQTGVAAKLRMLEDNWKTIREEGLAQLDDAGMFKSEEEGLRKEGDWKQFTLFARGRRDQAACDRAPKTCALFDNFPEATKCTRGQVKFSVMHPNTTVWPHTGPTNCRVRAHLGLVIPEGATITVADTTKTWTEGKFTIIDDSFDHSVQHMGSSLRLILIVDIWHPDISERDRQTVTPI